MKILEVTIVTACVCSGAAVIFFAKNSHNKEGPNDTKEWVEYLPMGQKLVSTTYVDNNGWYFTTRVRRTNETTETYFIKKSGAYEPSFFKLIEQ